MGLGPCCCHPTSSSPLAAHNQTANSRVQYNQQRYGTTGGFSICDLMNLGDSSQSDLSMMPAAGTNMAATTTAVQISSCHQPEQLWHFRQRYAVRRMHAGVFLCMHCINSILNGAIVHGTDGKIALQGSKPACSGGLEGNDIALYMHHRCVQARSMRNWQLVTEPQQQIPVAITSRQDT